MGDHHKVQLILQAGNLRTLDKFSKSDPMCVLHKKCGLRGNWEEVGRTETITNCGDPEWQTSFTLDFHFHQKQSLRFSVYDVDDDSGDLLAQDSLGTAECRLAQILAAPNHKLELYLSPYKTEPGDCGYIHIRAEELVDGTRDRVTLDLTAQNLDKKDLFSESDPFYIVHRSNPDGTETLVYRSEWIKNTANPDWAPITLDCAKLCLGDWTRNLRIEVYDWDRDGGHDYIGECNTSLEELKQGEGFQILQFDVINQKKKDKKGSSYKNSGQIVVKSVKIEQDTTFIDYVRGGLKINMICALDLTSSNGLCSSNSSLHHFKKNGENAYTTAIKTVAEVLQDYNYEKRVQAFGFGCSERGNCFPLNGSTRNPYCSGVDGLLKDYKECLESVKMSEPTHFSEVLQHVSNEASRAGLGLEYTVIMIITDGGITDLEQTKKILVKMSGQAVSVVLVGVGEGDMDSLVQLDSDKARLNSGDLQATRDIVQFVHMNEFLPMGSLDPADFKHELEAPQAKMKLARAVLQEIPRQVTEYMRSAGIGPKVPDIPDTFEEDFDKRFNM